MPAWPDNKEARTGGQVLETHCQSRARKRSWHHGPVAVQDAFRLSIDSGPQAVVRTAQATRTLLQEGSAYLTTLARGGTPAPPEQLLRRVFEKLGATYIKLGQFIASSPSLFPAAYVTEFQKCLDRTEPVPFTQIRSILQEELTQPIDQVFSRIDEVPLASASVAQVHVATLRSSGQDVVIKVLKPGVEGILRTDLNFLSVATKFLQALNPELERTSVAGIVEDIRTSMLDEVDFVKEAEHIAQFATFLETMGMTDVATCPHVYTQFSSRRALVMEKLDGVSLTDLQAIRSVSTSDPEQTLINALNTWMGSVMFCDTFHADVHAGNLLALRDGRVGFIDFGIVGRMAPATWRAVEALGRAPGTNDYTTMAQAMATMKATDAEVNIDALARDMEVLLTSMDTLGARVLNDSTADPSTRVADLADDTQVNRILLDMVRVGESHGIRFPREFGLVLKQMLYFDRYVQLLAPELEVFQDSRINTAPQPGPTIDV